MLAYICSNNGILRQQIGNSLRDLFRCKCLTALFIFRFRFERKYILFPFIMMLLLYFAVKSLQNHFGITYNVVIRFYIFINFRSVYVYLNYLRLAGKTVRI